MADFSAVPPSAPLADEALDVLIVDDDADITRLLTLYLAKFGYSVVPANDGQAALKILRQRRVALVVTDILMPQVDGYELIMKLRQIPGRPQIVATSGNPARFGMNFLKSAQQMGADRLLAKPFLPQDLLGIVREMIGPRTVAA